MEYSEVGGKLIWILFYFIVSYAQIVRYFFDEATIREIQLFRLVWD
jgi:hypothetical protein